MLLLSPAIGNAMGAPSFALFAKGGYGKTGRCEARAASITECSPPI